MALLRVVTTIFIVIEDIEEESWRAEESKIKKKMSSSVHHQAAIRRLEALFRDVKLEQDHHQHRVTSPDIRIDRKIVDKCCDIHGKHAKENCTYRRVSLSNVLNPRKDTIGRRDSWNVSNATLGRRSSLGLPMSPPKREIHPSTFPNTLRRNPLAASTGTINHFRKDSHANTLTSSLTRHEPIGRSMGCLKKDTLTSYNSPLRRDYVAKSMTSLPRPGPRRDSLNVTSSKNLSSLFGTSPSSLQSPSKSNLGSTTGSINSRSGSSGNLKSCIAGSNGNLRGHLSVTLKSDPLHGSNGNLRKDDPKLSVSTFPSYYGTARRASIDRRRFSTDSLENLKRNSWDTGRRGSSGSSGGWDDPIWEEGSHNNTNKVNQHPEMINYWAKQSIIESAKWDVRFSSFEVLRDWCSGSAGGFTSLSIPCKAWTGHAWGLVISQLKWESDTQYCESAVVLPDWEASRRIHATDFSSSDKNS